MQCPSCGHANSAATEVCAACGRRIAAIGPGSVLCARYEIIELLGKGGMGIVYRGHDRDLDERVAIKILRGDLGASADLARRFRSEIKLARKVRHRNVCAIHEYGQEGDLRFIVMEVIEGVDLKHILKERGA